MVLKIIEQLNLLMKDLKLYIEKNGHHFPGDWGTHNIIYNLDDGKLYNVDMEGFYTYGSSVSYDTDALNRIAKLKDNMYFSLEITKVLNVLKYTKSSGEHYSASHTNIGYHSIELDGNYFEGQRDCIARHKYISEEIDLTGCNILDIGCCQGGMLYPVSEIISKGVGIDFNYKNINACNKVKEYRKMTNLSFYVFDLDKESFNLMNDLCPEKIDVTFLFSICMWVKKWKEVIDFIGLKSDVLFIETNGSTQQQEEQIEYCSKHFPNIKKMFDRSEDDKSQKNRKFFICRKV